MDRETYQQFLQVWRDANDDQTLEFKNGEQSILSVFKQGAKFRVNLKRNMARNRDFARKYREEHNVE